MKNHLTIRSTGLVLYRPGFSGGNQSEPQVTTGALADHAADNAPIMIGNSPA